MRRNISKISAAAGKRLLDTGPLVALLSRRDSAHDECVASFEAFRGHLWTTEAVLTDAMHLLGSHHEVAMLCLDFFLRGAALLVPIDVRLMARCRELMDRYHDVPMNFADATLVALAEELEIGDIFTLDHRGFSTYRWNRTRRFTISP